MNTKTQTEPMTTVYSCFFPEVQEVIERFQKNLSHDFLRNNFKHELDDLATPLFDLYEELMEADNQAYAWPENRYYTNGSSEALFHLVAHTAQKGLPLYELRGEYQGYQAYAESLGVSFTDVSSDPDEILTLEPGIFFVSNPSAIQGDILDSEIFEAILKQHSVVLDLAYLGMTEPLRADLSHPSILAVTASMSKPFGLYYFRIGFCWSREELPSLYGNKWFKNADSILLAQEVLKRIDVKGLRERGQAIQRAVISSESLPVDPADIYILANTTDDIGRPEFRRDKYFRLCLTPFFYELLQPVRRNHEKP